MKGGLPEFVRVTGPNELTWPDYDGNRMYRSLGSITKIPAVGLLFITFDSASTRLRISGTAPSMRVLRPAWILPVRNGSYASLPRTSSTLPAIHVEIELIEESVHSPGTNYTHPEPEWKRRDYIRDVLHESS